MHTDLLFLRRSVSARSATATSVSPVMFQGCSLALVSSLWMYTDRACVCSMCLSTAFCFRFGTFLEWKLSQFLVFGTFSYPCEFSSRVCSVEPLLFLDATHVVKREEDCLSPHSIFSQSPERHFRSKLRRSLKGTRHRRPFPRTQGKMGSYSETLLIPRVYYLSSHNLLHQDL